MMQCDEIKIQRAMDFNNGKPGGRQGWIVWRNYSIYPLHTYDLEKVIELIREQLA